MAEKGKTKKTPMLLLFVLALAGASLLYLRVSQVNFKAALTLDSPSKESAIVTPPCNDAADQLPLGRPVPGDLSRLAHFKTRGGDIYLLAKNFDRGHILGDATQSAVYIGPADKPPLFDEQRGTVSNTLMEVHAKEGKYSQVELPPGSYWLWASNSPEIVLAGCGNISKA